MIMIKVIKSLLAMTMVISVCIAEDINISGTVTDTGGTPIVGAAVQLEKGGLPTTTGADGKFTITGTIGIIGQINQPLQNLHIVRIDNGLLCIGVQEKSIVEITTYTLQGRVVFGIHKTMDAGTHSIALPHTGAGVYFYKFKIGGRELVIKSHSIGRISAGQAVSFPSVSTTASAKKERSYSPINDVIAVTKAGYLNYRIIVTNSDTSGIEIEMFICADTVIDIDGNVYQAVQIGNQIWMAENLRTTKFNDGSAIPHITDSATWINDTLGAYCFYNNTTNAESIKKYGALYNWYVVNPTNPQKIAPLGWHVPTDVEWTILEKYLVLNGYNWDGTTDTNASNKIAKSLASKTNWVSDITTGTIGCDLTKNNRSGFSALPGGCRHYGGSFYAQSLGGYWWSATAYDATTAWSCFLSYDYYFLTRGNHVKGCGFSVRLVRDLN